MNRVNLWVVVVWEDLQEQYREQSTQEPSSPRGASVLMPPAKQPDGGVIGA